MMWAVRTSCLDGELCGILPPWAAPAFAATHAAPATPSAGWVMGASGANCGAVCEERGACREQPGAEQAVTTELVGSAFAEAGCTCRSYHGRCRYAGAPFSSGRSADDCAPFYPQDDSGDPPMTSSCTENDHPNHAPRCYCQEGYAALGVQRCMPERGAAARVIAMTNATELPSAVPGGLRRRRRHLQLRRV